jgi:predicted HD phosphohydrolase
VREQSRWVVEAHGDFQMIYYGHLTKGGDQYKRNRHKGHRYFDDCVQFCERWDQSSFDPGYDFLLLGFFRDMIREVFARTPYDNAAMAAKDKPLVDEILAKKTHLNVFPKRINFF